jgi:hypothetical protein
MNMLQPHESSPTTNSPLLKEWSEKQVDIPSQNTHRDSHEMVVSGSSKDATSVNVGLPVGGLIGAAVVA